MSVLSEINERLAEIAGQLSQYLNPDAPLTTLASDICMRFEPKIHVEFHADERHCYPIALGVCIGLVSHYSNEIRSIANGPDLHPAPYVNAKDGDYDE